MKSPLIAFFIPFAGRLRFPVLFGITVVLFLVNLIVPDLIPWVDELLLGLFALVLAGLRKRKSGPSQQAGTEPLRRGDVSPSKRMRTEGETRL